MSKCQPPWVAPLFNLDRDMRTRVLTNPSNEWKMAPCLSQDRISTTCIIWVPSNDKKCKYIFMFSILDSMAQVNYKLLSNYRKHQQYTPTITDDKVHWPGLRAGLLCCNFFGQPGSVSKFPPLLWEKLWVGRGYTEISRYFSASWINWVTLVTKIKLLYSLRF